MLIPRSPISAAAILTAVVLAGGFSAACAPDSGSSGGFAQRDSAGIRIVENSAPAWSEGEGWRLSDEPTLEIGVLDGAPEYQFYRAFDGARLSDGRIVVANAGTHELRVYDSNGDFLGSSGREGAGPGEFKNIGVLEVFAYDSLLTWDWGNNRSQVFDP